MLSGGGGGDGSNDGMQVGSAPAEECLQRYPTGCQWALRCTQSLSHPATSCAHAQERATVAADVTTPLRRDWAASRGPGPGARAPTRPPTPTLAAAAAPGLSASSVSVSRGSCPGERDSLRACLASLAGSAGAGGGLTCALAVLKRGRYVVGLSACLGIGKRESFASASRNVATSR